MSKQSFILPVCCIGALFTYPVFSVQSRADEPIIIATETHTLDYDTESKAMPMSLAELYSLADEQSYQIHITEQSVRAATEGVKQAKSSMLPHLKLSLSGSYIGDATLMNRSFSTSGTTEVYYAGMGVQEVENGLQPTPHWGNMFSVEASQIIYAGGVLSAGVEMAKLGERMAQLNSDQSRQDVRFMLTGYYLDLVRLGSQVSVLEQHIALTERVLQQMQARQNAGVVLRNDLMRYELQLKQLQLSLIRLHDARSIIQHQLANTLHIDENYMIEPDTVSLAEEYRAVEQATGEHIWQMRAADGNISIRQAKAAEQMSEQQVRVTRAASVPTIAIVAKDELFGPYTQDLIPVNANINTWFVGIGIQYDLGSLWHNHRAIRKAKAEREIAQTHTELIRESVNNNVHSAYRHFLTAFTEVETEVKQVELATENYMLVEKRYNNQLALLTDLLDASNMKLQADMALVNARIGLLYTYYQLKYTTHSL